MARNRYIKTHSNYVIKELHQSTNIGNIYERDFMTISELNSYAPGSLPAYGLNGFKMAVSDGLNLKKKHHYGNWLKNDACEKKSMYWTMNCLEDTETNGDINDAEIKPNLNSVIDFACYGSSYKMIESAITNIINKYPGEVYLTDKRVNIDGITYYAVDNPFNIEFDRHNLFDDSTHNSMRIFSDSYDKYIFYNNNDVVSPHDLTWNLQLLNQNPCRMENDRLSMVDLGEPFGPDKPRLLLYYFIYDGKKTLFHDGSYINGRISPSSKVKRDFFNNLKGFEKVLLNKKTNYTAILETPKETEKGNVMSRCAYTWPKTGYGNWNIDTNSVGFYHYFDALLSIGEFYDSYFSDNIWRAMTHEAIINFDWTLVREDSNGLLEEQGAPHSERVKAFIHVAGRVFDDLKQYIDGIGNANAITYNECGNKPDSFLNDELLNYGWDVKMPLVGALNKYISDRLYPGFADGHTVQDATNEFYRRLLLNSMAILSAKGTKRSIEMMAALFGYRSLNFIEHSYHEVKRDGKIKNLKWVELTFEEQKDILKYSYDMSEYVYVAGTNSAIWMKSINDVKEKNKLKLNYDFNNPDELQGLPLREVMFPTKEYPVRGWDENEEEYILYYIPDYKNYLIPWFDRTVEYDSNIYYESKGGWGLKQTTIGQFDKYNEVVIDTNDKFKVYDESVKYLKFVQTIDDLLKVTFENPVVNDIYYVYDLTGGSKYDWGYLTKKVDGQLIPESLHTLSHYFILKNENYDNHLGVIRDNYGKPVFVDKNVIFNDEGAITNWEGEGFPERKYGWKNISEQELSQGKTSDAKRVYYLESIIEHNNGNNPHVGYGKYDDGNTYKEFFEDVFKGARDEDSFIDIEDSETPNDKEFGFELEKEIDNVKCWYFSDTLNNEHTLEYLYSVGNDKYENGGFTQPSVGDGDFVRFSDMRNDDKNDNFTKDLFSSKQYKLMEPYNPEDPDNVDDEAAANSIINSKQLLIEFTPDIVSPGSMYDFIENSLMHYVKQVIPSTTILKYYVPMREMDVNCYHRTYLQSAIITE